MKRAIREAAEGGFEQLAWTPGSVQNKRYPDPNRPDSCDGGFYDKMLPAAANKIGKPHGAGGKGRGGDRTLTGMSWARTSAVVGGSLIGYRMRR